MSLADAPALHLGFASLHVVVGHVGASLVYWVRFRRSPLALYRRGSSPHQRVTRLVSVASLVWASSLMGSALSPALRASLLGRPLFEVPNVVAWGLAAGGLALMVASQASMGVVFRIGQDEQAPPESLRRDGLHALSRNPIYLGSWTCLFGMTLWHPSVLLLGSCALVGAGIHGLVLAEESFLRARFGEAFDAYCTRTPRYLLAGRS